jgi:hypothetical protein
VTGRGYIYVVDWERFQHYKDRRPPWIKLYVDLLSNDEWLALEPADKVLLQTIWMLTALHGHGRVIAVLSQLQAAANLPLSNRYQGLERLKDAGFIEVRASKGASEPASTMQAPETETDAETETEGPKAETSVPDVAAFLGYEPVRTDAIGKAITELGSHADQATEHTIRKLIQREHISQNELELARGRIASTPAGTNRAAYFVGALKNIARERNGHDPSIVTEATTPVSSSTDVDI